MESNSNTSSRSIMALSNQRKAFEGIRMENPFSFKVAQIFTGFGFGCGVGIGVGSPVNLGLFESKDGKSHREFLAKKPCAIPMVSEVMSATRGATGAFSGVTQHVNGALRKLGAKNIEAGIGCGLGFGYGFGVGLAVKPSVVNQIQSCLVQGMAKLMMKFGMAPNRSNGQGVLPMSMQSSMKTINKPSSQNPVGNIMQLATKMPEPASQVLPDYGNINAGSMGEKLINKSTAADTSFGRTEKVLSNFLQNPVLREEGMDLKEVAGRLRSENNMLQMLLKHQQIIEELMEENEKLRQILVEDLKIPPSKLRASSSFSSRSKPACADCFECRRKQRKK